MYVASKGEDERASAKTPRPKPAIGDSNLNIWERLDSKCHQDQNGCLVWDGALRDGYGLVSYHNKLVSTHRLIWELTFGAIPSGLQVLHKCDNRRCMRIDHLFIGTQADNLKDAISKKHLDLVECGKKRSINARRDKAGKYLPPPVRATSL